MEPLKLLFSEAKDLDFNPRNEWGVTPLMKAAILGQIEALDLLLQRPEIDLKVSNVSRFSRSFSLWSLKVIFSPNCLPHYSFPAILEP